jgi:hypothetical protein
MKGGVEENRGQAKLLLLEIDETKRRINSMHLNWNEKANRNFDHAYFTNYHLLQI